MPPIPINKTLARMSANWPTRCAASRLASVSRRFVCTQRIGSFSHQPSRAPAKLLSNRKESASFLVVIFQSEMRNEIFPLHPAQGVLQFHQLNKDIVFRIEPGRRHRAFEVKREPLLDTLHPGSLRKIEKQDQIEHERRSQYRIAAKKIDLDLHRIAEPTENVDVVPTFFGIAARRIVIDPHRVIQLFIKLRVEIGLENLLQNR